MSGGSGDGSEDSAGTRSDAPVESTVEKAESQVEESPGSRTGVRLTGRRKGSPFRRESEPEARSTLTAEQRFLVLDAWKRSGLGASDFAKIVQISSHTLAAWRRRFDAMGPEGLSDRPRMIRKGSRLPEATRRAVLSMKETHPDWGSERIHAMLLRGEGFAASAGRNFRVSSRTTRYASAISAGERAASRTWTI